MDSSFALRHSYGLTSRQPDVYSAVRVDAMEFEWNEKKAGANARKHGVTFHEAATVFGDPLAITFSDPDHSAGEQRHLTFGESRSGRLIVVSHVDRRERVRIISGRPMTRGEKSIYEEG